MRRATPFTLAEQTTRIATSAQTSVQTRQSQSAKKAGGMRPMMISRMRPPPKVVVIAITMTPNGSMRLLMAVRLPERAKLTAPRVCMMKMT